MTITERIEDRVNALGPRALDWALHQADTIILPRWMLVLFAVGIGEVLLLDLRGDLGLRAWLTAVMQSFL